MIHKQLEDFYLILIRFLNQHRAPKRAAPTVRKIRRDKNLTTLRPLNKEREAFALYQKEERARKLLKKIRQLKPYSNNWLDCYEKLRGLLVELNVIGKFTELDIYDIEIDRKLRMLPEAYEAEPKIAGQTAIPSLDISRLPSPLFNFRFQFALDCPK